MMPCQAVRRARAHAWPAAAGLVLGLLALGPALGRGFVLSYDMVFVPSPPIGAADLGLAGGPPRAVPSDLVVALVARVIPAEFVQKIILLAIFVLACSGAAALLATWPQRVQGGRPGLLAQLVAGVAYVWNPFVAERLIMGQWALLLGYAGLPWVLREIGRDDGPIRPGRLAVALLPAAVGGFAAMSISALAAAPAAICGHVAWSARVRRLAVVLGIFAVLSLPWLIPAFAVPVHADPNGASAFAARADTPFGGIGSLLMLGGIWNAQAVPAGYGGWASTGWLVVVLVALAGYLLAGGRRACPGLGVGAVAGVAIAAVGLTGPTITLLRDAISFWPGFAILRDGQQFLAPLALTVAIGLGAGVSWLADAAKAGAGAGAKAGAGAPAKAGASWLAGDAKAGAGVSAKAGAGGGALTGSGSASGPAVVLGVLALLAPVLLLPGLAWGAAGRLRAVRYPADWMTARQIIDGDRRPGSVLLLPWAQYRRYGWNNGEAVYDPWPRLIARAMIWNDALDVGNLVVAAESPQARRLGPVISSGRPLTGPLRAAGVRYVLVDAGPLLGERGPRLAALARLPGAQVLLASGDLILFRLPSANAAAGQ
jgi:hypothetical protein